MKTNFLLAQLAGLAVLAGPAPSVPGATTQSVSASSQTNVAGTGHSFLPSFSADGRFLVFVSQANNLLTNDNVAPHLDVFVHDHSNGVTRLVSATPLGIAGGEGDSNDPMLSSNGQQVVFASTAGNLVANDTNEASDVFVRDLAGGVTTLVSVNAARTGSGDGPSTSPLLSLDGRWVVFESMASDLVAGDTNNARDIFARDLWSNITLRVSADLSVTNLATTGFGSAAMTPDGRRMAFVSTTTNLIPAGVSFAPILNGEAYVREMTGGQTWWASEGVAPYCADWTNGYRALKSAISADGRVSAFLVTPHIRRYWYYLEPPPTNAFLFCFDSASEQLTLIATNVFPGCVPQVSADGRYLAYEDGTNVWRWDRTLASNELVSLTTNGESPRGGISRAPILNADGQGVLFYSSASGLVTNPVNGFYQLYLRDMSTGTTRLLSANRVGAASGADNFPGAAVLSTDGTAVAFDSAAADLVADDLNQATDMFLRNLADGTTTLISAADAGRPSVTSVAHTSVKEGCVSADGQVVLFSSFDNNLAPGDTNGLADLFVRDRTTQRTIAVTTRPEGSFGTNLYFPGSFALSANGRFAAVAQPFARGGSFAELEIWRRDLQMGNSELVTLSPLYGTTVGGYPLTNVLAISPDGSQIAYEYDFYAPPQGSKILITNFNAQTTNVVIGDVTNDYFHPVFTPDARWLVFFGTPAFGASGTPTQVYAYDLTNQQVRLVSFGADLSLRGCYRFSVSADSRYVAYDWLSAVGIRVFRHDLMTETNNLLVCTNCFDPSISADGRWVAYSDRPWVNPSTLQVHVKDLQTAQETPVSVNRFGTNSGNGNSYSALITPDGRYVVFCSLAGDLVDNDTNRVADVFLRDRLLGTTTCLSVNPQGVPASGSSGNPVLSADGRTVVFQSCASDLVTADYNDKRDVFAVRIGADDTDGDGLDDDWEMACFNTLARDGRGDFDQDGVSDGQEFLAGTDPTNTGSVLRALTVTPVAGGQVAVLWHAVPGRTYQVQFKDGWADGNWTDLPGTVIASSATGVKVDDTCAVQAHRFYRVVVVP